MTFIIVTNRFSGRGCIGSGDMVNAEATAGAGLLAVSIPGELPLPGACPQGKPQSIAQDADSTSNRECGKPISQRALYREEYNP